MAETVGTGQHESALAACRERRQGNPVMMANDTCVLTTEDGGADWGRDALTGRSAQR
jgi:hypothetical protein